MHLAEDEAAQAAGFRAGIGDCADRGAAAVTGMEDGDTVITVLNDRRLLVYRDSQDRRKAEMLTVDLSSGTRKPLGFDKYSPGSAWSLSELFWPMRAADGRRLFYMRIKDQPRSLTSLALGSNTLTPPIPMWQVVGCPDGTTALITSPDRQRLERNHLSAAGVSSVL